MASPEHLQILSQGVKAWNEWRTRDPDVVPDLSGTNIGAADLQGADLRGAKLQEAKLGESNLERADLSGTDFRDADLQGANLQSANLLGAQLREADLRDSDLSTATGLQPQQLAGADLSLAKLPGPIDKLFENLDAVRDISESARKLFMAMLAACLYSWLTLATTTDVNLITNRASSPLPIIQTGIPIVGFYVVAPLLLLCVYFYFHFYLQKLWEELGSLPAIFPDGRPLHARSDPWLLNDLVRSHLAKLKADRPFMSYFQHAISIVLAWWVVPVTLLMFWGRYLPRHDYAWLGTKLHVVLLAISITAAVFLYRLAAGTLRGDERRHFSWAGAVKSLRAYSALGIFLATGAVFVLVSLGAIRGVPSGNNDPWPKAYGRYSWVPRAMTLIHYSPFANLAQADVSVKPPNWTGKSDSELDLVKSAELRGANLRHAWAPGAFLVNAELLGALLESADLRSSDLRRANLVEADLHGANLESARLGGANLGGADLTGVELFRADLTAADLTEADLAAAELGGANVSRAILTRADLRRATLHRADLTGAQLRDADLEFADFRTPVFVDPVAPPVVVTTRIKPDALKSARHWDKAYYDYDLLQKLGLPPDHNEKLKREQGFPPPWGE